MIICHKCHKELIFDETKLSCTNCEYSADIENNIIYFNKEIDNSTQYYDSRCLDQLHKVEDEHFWFRIRKQYILSLFQKYINKSDEVLEIGAGTGNVAKSLIENDYNIKIGELHSSGLKYALKNGISQGYQFDILKSPFIEHFDALINFDVLAHIDDDQLAVEKIYNTLKPNGIVISTFPAHKWLWHREDRVLNNHKRRYEQEDIKQLFEKANFEILEIKNIFTLLLPLFYIRSLINKDDGSTVTKEEEDNFNISISPFLNKILYFVALIEFKLLRKFNFSFGSSIILVARKK